MDVSNYRKKFDEQMDRIKESQARRRESLEEAARGGGGQMDLGLAADALSPPAEDPVEDAVAVVRNRESDAEERAVTLHSIAIEISTREDLIRMVFDLLRDSTEPTMLRLETLRILQSFTFSSRIFNTLRPEYMALLRELVDDEDATLRERVLEVLAQQKDGYAQKRLMEGLQDPSKALVAPERAIRFLGHDVHAEYFPILKEVIKKPPSAAAKREAVRLLAADPSSRDMLVDMLTDKKQSRQVREASAIALQALAPEVFEEQARRIVLDSDEHRDLQALSINALAHFKGQEALSKDAELHEQIEQLHKESSSKKVRSSAARYISKRNE